VKYSATTPERETPMSPTMPGLSSRRVLAERRLPVAILIAIAALLFVPTGEYAPPAPPAQEERPSFEPANFTAIPGVERSDSYRLRLDVRYDPTLTAADAGGGDPSPARKDLPRFCVLLERDGPEDYNSLCWDEGRLTFSTCRGGKRVETIGVASAALPVLRLLAGTSEPVSLRFVIDRLPRLWTVSFLGEEIILVAADDGAPRRVLPPVAPETLPPPAYAWASTPHWKLVGRSCQPTERIEFEDAFERAAFGENGEYRLWSGEWRLDSVRDTERAMNAFRLRGRSPTSDDIAVATVGHDFWRRYRLSAAVKFPSKDTTASGGLVFAAKHPDRMGLVRWRCIPEAEPAAAGADRFGRGLLEIVEATRIEAPDWNDAPSAYVERVIASRSWRPRSDQWYLMTLTLFDETGELEIGGRRLAFDLPSGLRSGECGLFSESTSGVLFDDVRVRSHDERRHTATSIVPAASRNGHAVVDVTEGDGAWIEFEPRRGVHRVDFTWHDAYDAAYVLGLDGAAGRGTLSCFGQSLGGFELPRDMDTSGVRVEIRGGSCKTFELSPSGSRQLANIALPTPPAGPVEIAGEGDRRAYRRLAHGPIAPLPAVTLKSHAFNKVDVRMNKKGQLHSAVRWKGFTAWIEDRGAWDVTEGKASFRTPLWGDFDIAYLPTEDTLERESALSLTLDLPEGEPVRLEASPGDCAWNVVTPDDRKRHVKIEDAADGAAPRLALRRAANVLTASVYDHVVSRTPLPAGVPVRVSAVAPGAAPAHVTIRAESVSESLFTFAPVEWVRWRGHVDMTCKWQCDPRWSFLGFWADQKDTKRESAGLFTRDSYLGDQYLHFNWAFKDMLGGRVNRRRYVRRDLNFAFACSEEDLQSGYCLLLGGFDNRGTQLLRKGKLVHESDKFAFPRFDGRHVTDLHWRWFNLEVSRRGGAITALLDGKQILTWTDPEPLPGGHVAAWVLGGGMILGRTRFSAEARGGVLAAFDEDTPPKLPPAGWRALDVDHAAEFAATSKGATRVSNTAGGGHFAAEYTCGEDAPGAVAFRASDTTVVRLTAWYAHDDDGHAVSDGKTLPADGTWHPIDLTRNRDRPTRLVFGNDEPQDYAAAGIGTNVMGDWYEVMFFPTYRQAELFSIAGRYVDRGAPEDAR